MDMKTLEQTQSLNETKLEGATNTRMTPNKTPSKTSKTKTDQRQNTYSKNSGATLRHQN